jgi:thiosulfate/3-mercaptopyruvate sulfurtransferase
MSQLVDTAWLERNIDLPDLRIVDCRFKLDDRGAGVRGYREAHIKGAVFVDVHRDLTGTNGSGRHPLPAPDAFATAMSRAGIGPDTLVIAYDQGMVGGAARLWWLLRHFGHHHVAVLAGGLAGWRGPLVGGEQRVPARTFAAVAREGDTVDAAELAGRLGDPRLLLIDARAAERYGSVGKPDAGHLPGTANVPAATALDAGDSLARSAGKRELIAYCGSGISACVVLLALSAAGREDARLYPGSWSDWSTRELPVEYGPERVPRLFPVVATRS